MSFPPHIILCILFSEIHKYGDFYRFSDVRPPFTYAALIRQVRLRNDGRHDVINSVDLGRYITKSTLLPFFPLKLHSGIIEKRVTGL